MDHLTSSSDSETDAPVVKQIPGYYYDKKKKKYFKIQSQAFNPESSLTSSSIKKKRNKKRSKKLMKSVETEQKKICHTKNFAQMQSQKELIGCRSSFSSAIQKLRLQVWAARHYSYAYPRGAPLVTSITSTDELFRIDYGCGRLYADPLHDLITGQTSTHIDELTCYTNYHMAEYRPGVMVIAFLPDSAAVPHSTLLRTVTKAKANDYHLSVQRPHLNDTIAVCSSPKSSSRLFIADRSVDEAVYLIGRDMERQHNGRAHMLDRSTSCLAMKHTSSTDVYSGSRNGGIYHTDTRSKSPSIRLYHYQESRKSRITDRRTLITSILSLNDDTTLAVSHVTGMKSLLDLRMGKPVEYNRDLVSPTSFDLSVLKKDDTGQYLTASGTTEFVHIWDTKMLNTVKLVRLRDRGSEVVCSWRCELTSRYGDLNLLAMSDTSYTVYS